MHIGDLVWFCWWKGYSPPSFPAPDLTRKAALILEEYESLDTVGDLWYDIYIFQDTRRLIVDQTKLEPMVRQGSDNEV